MWADRITASALVATVWLLAGALSATPAERERLLYTCLVTAGYGHLIGAWWLAPRRQHATRALAERLLLLAFGAGWIAIGFLLYARLLALSLLFLVPFVLAGVWHTVENDRALGRTRSAKGPLPPVSSRFRDHAWIALALPLVLPGGIETEAPTPIVELPTGFTPGLVDVYGIPSFYHVITWLIRALRRISALGQEAGIRPAARRLALLAAIHALPVTLLVGLGCVGSQATRALARIFYGPDVYLYLSTLHVAQTALARSGFHASDLVPLVRSRRCARRSPRAEDPS